MTDADIVQEALRVRNGETVSAPLMERQTVADAALARIEAELAEARSHLSTVQTALAGWAARAENAEAEVKQLREAWDAASWYVDCLRNYIDKIPVRGMAEAEAGYESARAALEEK